jgi:hypothetical protein
MIRHVLTICVVVAAPLFVAPRNALAQAIPPDTITQPADTIPSDFPGPRGAFIRALIVPGWGHFHIGAPRRGAVYATIQGASWFMLVKTLGKLGDARDVEERLAVLGRDSVLNAVAQDTMLARVLMCTTGAGTPVCDPLLFDQAVDTYPGLVGARSLVTSRERHRQDWIVYTLFFTFVAAADAYVTAHFADIPVDITTDRNPDGGIAIGLQFNVGGRSP